MKTGNLSEICKDLNCSKLYDFKFKRKYWDNNYAKVENIGGIDIFIFYGKANNYARVGLSYYDIIKDDWYIVDDKQEDKDISNRLSKLKYKLVDTINEVLNTLED